MVIDAEAMQQYQRRPVAFADHSCRLKSALTASTPSFRTLDGEGSEFEIWADDLRGLAKILGLPPFIVGGSSSGCRLATILALRHRDAIRALLMMRVTGGAFAVK